MQKSFGDNHPGANVCIVGGGAVGLALAVSLARSGLSVTVLEAGSNRVTPSSQKLMEAEQTAKQFRNATLDRYRVLGGGTTFWGGQVFELGDHIIANRPDMPIWPITPQDLKPWYGRAARLLGLDPSFDDDQVWHKVGAPNSSTDDELELVLSRWVPTRNFTRLFRDDLRKTSNLVIDTDSTVTGFDLSGSHINGVNVRSISGRERVVRASYFVLAAGAVESARLLLHNSRNGTEYPWTRNKVLGRFFSDHIGIDIGRFSPNGRKYERHFNTIRLEGRKYWPKLRLKPHVQLQEGLLDAACEFSFDGRLGTHIDNIKLLGQSLLSGTVTRGRLRSAVAAFSAATAVPALAARYLREHRIGQLGSGHATVKAILEQFPASESRVALTQVRDSLGLYKAAIHWRLSRREVETARFVANSVRTYIQKHKLGTFATHPELFQADDYLERAGFDTIHHMGTTRMATEESSGVVDSWAKVFGTDNLYIAGASIFPTAGFANPTFTAIALALRTGAHIQARITSRPTTDI